MRPRGTAVSVSLLRIHLRLDGILTSGASGPLSRFFTKSGCIVIHRRMCIFGVCALMVVCIEQFADHTLHPPGTATRHAKASTELRRYLPSGTDPYVYFTQFSLPGEGMLIFSASSQRPSPNGQRENSRPLKSLWEDLPMAKDWYPRWRLVIRWVPITLRIGISVFDCPTVATRVRTWVSEPDIRWISHDRGFTFPPHPGHMVQLLNDRPGWLIHCHKMPLGLGLTLPYGDRTSQGYWEQ